MSKESIHENGPQVKRKACRTIPDGIALTVADILKLTKRAQGPKKNLASKIKWAFRTYIEKCPAPSKDRPGLTSATKRVACFLVDWYQLRDGYARPPISRIAEELSIGITSVKRAVAALHDLGIIFVKSGGPTRRQGFGTVASRYVPNFWLVINRDTGEIIKNANYDFMGLNAIRGAGDYAQNDTRGAYAQNDTRGDTLNAIRGAGDYAQNGPRYLSTSAGANASPSASAGAAAAASAAPLEKEIGPLPKHDSDSVKVRFARLKDLAYRSGVPSNGLINLFAGKGTPAAMIGLQGICKREIFNFGKPVFGILENNPPAHGPKYGRVIIYGDEGAVDFVEDGLALTDLDSNSWLVIEYRVSPAYQIEAAAKVQELRTGI